MTSRKNTGELAVGIKLRHAGRRQLPCRLLSISAEVTALNEDSNRYTLSERMWRRAEGVIEPFARHEREVLPRDALRLHHVLRAPGARTLHLLLLVGGLSGAVDASLYWALGYLIDLLESSTPATLMADHWPELLAFVILIPGGPRWAS